MPSICIINAIYHYSRVIYTPNYCAKSTAIQIAYMEANRTELLFAIWKRGLG